MKSLSGILTEKDRAKELIRDPRQKMIDTFWQRLNAERKAEDMKPLPFVAVSVKVQHLGLDDLGFLLKKCQQSANFSRTFFGLLKVKK
jgi:hypothetical protein